MEDSKLTSKCHICEQEFSNCDLEAHFLECDQEHKSDFEICDKVFQTVHLLDNHNSVHDESKNVVEKVKKCNLCQKFLMLYLENHTKTVQKDLRDKCHFYSTKSTSKAY